MEIALVFSGYFLGSLLPAEWLIRLKRGVRPQEMGENPGASAAYRLGGPVIGFLTFIFDLAKGALPLFISTRLGITGTWLAAIAASPVIGACWPIGRFKKGGRGAAAAAGALLCVAWWETFASLLVSFIPVPFLKKRHGLVMGLVAFPAILLSILYFHPNPMDALLVFGAVFGVLILRFLTGGFISR
jgi:glycerol-3-phosphate acyltransferase PlsY